MFKNNIKKIILTFFILILQFTYFSQVVLAIGISPGEIKVDKMINGQKKAVNMTIMRSNTDEDVSVKVSVSGEAAHYVILPYDTILLPVGQSRAVFNFFINPVGAAMGNHSASILFSESPGLVNSAQSGSGMIVGVGSRITFDITDQQKREYDITSLLLDGASEENVPPFITFYVKNDGNVEVKPDKIEYKIVDVTDNKNIKSGKIGSEDLAFSPPWESSRQFIQLKDGMPVGRYQVYFDFYDDNKIKKSFNNLNLDVLPTGALKQSGEFTDLKLNGDKFAPNDLLKFEANIKSTGENVIEPILYIEIKSNNKTEDILRSDKKVIPRGQSAGYLTTYRLSKVGNYEADAYFEYGVKQTEHKKINFSIGNVGPEKNVSYSAVGQRSVMTIVFVSVGSLGILVLFGWFIKRKYFVHSRRHKKVIHKK